MAWRTRRSRRRATSTTARRTSRLFFLCSGITSSARSAAPALANHCIRQISQNDEQTGPDDRLPGVSTCVDINQLWGGCEQTDSEGAVVLDAETPPLLAQRHLRVARRRARDSSAYRRRTNRQIRLIDDARRRAAG